MANPKSFTRKAAADRLQHRITGQTAWVQHKRTAAVLDLGDGSPELFEAKDMPVRHPELHLEICRMRATSLRNATFIAEELVKSYGLENIVHVSSRQVTAKKHEETGEFANSIGFTFNEARADDEGMRNKLTEFRNLLEHQLPTRALKAASQGPNPM